MIKIQDNKQNKSLQELVRPLPIDKIVWINPNIMGGEPCFYNTRVPLSTLWVHIDAGESLEVFFRDFEGVTPEQVHGLIGFAAQSVNEKISGLSIKNSR